MSEQSNRDGAIVDHMMLEQWNIWCWNKRTEMVEDGGTIEHLMVEQWNRGGGRVKHLSEKQRNRTAEHLMVER